MTPPSVAEQVARPTPHLLEVVNALQCQRQVREVYVILTGVPEDLLQEGLVDLQLGGGRRREGGREGGRERGRGGGGGGREGGTNSLSAYLCSPIMHTTECG